MFDRQIRKKFQYPAFLPLIVRLGFQEMLDKVGAEEIECMIYDVASGKK